MLTLKQLCTPRDSVFDHTRRDVVLDLTDLGENRINGNEFFTENYLTDGMKRLLRESFRRFEGHSASGVIKLTQSMGGGKTHNMIALGLLAKHPELREKVMGDISHTSYKGRVRVVAFTGRESDAPLGIWGAIAEQLGKKELFNDYYSPLSAPGQTAWINLLKGDPKKNIYSLKGDNLSVFAQGDFLCKVHFKKKEKEVFRHIMVIRKHQKIIN